MMDCCNAKNEKGCCKDMEKNSENMKGHSPMLGQMKGGKKMETSKIVIWVIIGFLLLAVIYTVFFRGAADTNSLASTAGQAVSSASSGMVGGC